MRDYEAIFIFRSDEELFNQGKTLVTEQFNNADVKIVNEEDMGNRELAYPVKNETSGHYYFYDTQIEPDAVLGINQAIKLMDPVLKCLFVRK